MNEHHFFKPCPICSASNVSYERTINGIVLLKCQECHFVYINLGEEQIKSENSSCDDDFSAEQEERQNFIDTIWFTLIAKKIKNIINRGRILDIGCGNGVLLKHFLDPQWLASGVDFSPWAKKFAQRYGYKLIDCELEKTDFPDGCLDVITSTSTLEHISKPLDHVEKIIKLLKPGGVAYFSGIPNYGSLSVRLNISKFFQNLPPKHTNYFTYHTMSQLFSHPKISNEIGQISITSYGIPDLHRAYYLIRKIFRIIIPKLFKRPVKPVISDNIFFEVKNYNSLMSRVITMVLIVFYYSPGKLFHLGDKLEVIVIKK